MEPIAIDVKPDSRLVMRASAVIAAPVVTATVALTHGLFFKFHSRLLRDVLGLMSESP
jgi:hypothetical protein